MESRYKDAEQEAFLTNIPWRPECCVLEGMLLINTTPLGSHKTMSEYAKFLFMRYIVTQSRRHRSGWSGFNRTTFLRDMAAPGPHTRERLWRTTRRHAAENIRAMLSPLQLLVSTCRIESSASVSSIGCIGVGTCDKVGGG